MFTPQHVILLQPAKFRHDQAMHGRVITSYRFYKMVAIESEFTSGFRFNDGTCSRKCITICIPNFDEISQCTAEIKLLPVSENGRLPYLNCTSGFDFYLCVVIGMSFCIHLPNFIAIRQLAAEL